MKTQMRLFWLVALMFFATGCSGYRTIGHSLPDLTRDLDPEVGGDLQLRKGDEVRLQLVDGKQDIGIVRSVSSRAIVLEADSRGDPSREYSAAEIQAIEAPSRGDPFLVVGLVSLVFVMGYALTHMDVGIDLSGWDWGEGGIVY